MVRTRFVPRTRSFAITVAGIRGLPGRPVDDDSHIALVVPGTSASADIEHRFVLRWSACRRGRERRVRLVGMRNVRVRPDRWDGAVAGYAGLAALCRPLTVEAAAAVALPGIALVVLAARRKPPPLVVLARRHVAPWAGLVVLLAGWEATAAAWGNDAAHPTLSPAARPTAVDLSRTGRRLDRLAGRWSLAGDPVTPYAVLLSGYLSLLAVALLPEGCARSGREPFRPIAAVLDTALSTRGGRWLVWATWFWVGFHFLAR